MVLKANDKHDPDHQTCCPPGQVYSLDTTWQPPRCGADHEVDNVSDLGTQSEMSFTCIHVSFQPPMVCVDADYDQVSDYKFSHNDNVGPPKISPLNIRTIQLLFRLST